MDCSYVISVSLGTGCYRHVQIDAQSQLITLSDAILDAFEFDNDHAHAFFMNNRCWDSEEAYFCPGIDVDMDDDEYDDIDDEEDDEMFEKDRHTDAVTLDELELDIGQRFVYLFDFGDEWRFQCRVLRAIPEMTKQPKVVRSVGEAPDQY